MGSTRGRQYAQHTLGGKAVEYALQDVHIQPLCGYKTIFASSPGLHPGLFMFNRFAVFIYVQATLGGTGGWLGQD